MEYWNELLIEAVKPGGIFPPAQTIHVVAPEADEFFTAINEADSEYFENASDRLTIDGQTCDFIYCFGFFYVKNEDGTYRFKTIEGVKNFLSQNAVELEVERESRFDLQQGIDSDLLRL